MFEDVLHSFPLLRVQALGAAIALFLGALFVRRRYFSPLSDFPGPFVASFTSSWWHLWHIFKGHTEAAIVELHQNHGSSIGPF